MQSDALGMQNSPLLCERHLPIALWDATKIGQDINFSAAGECGCIMLMNGKDCPALQDYLPWIAYSYSLYAEKTC
jgi:hypothetical protein